MKKKGNYITTSYPSPDGHPTRHRPRRNYWGNSEVKGMEFEVVFFYDIDTALSGCSSDIMRRYLYVGASRATTHLAATFTKEEGNEDVIKYFDRKTDNWKL